MAAPPPAADPAVSVDDLLRLARDVASATDPAWGRELARRYLERRGLVRLVDVDARPSVTAQAADTARRAMLALRRRPAILPPSGCHAC